MFTVRIENAENVTAVDECFIDVGNQARKLVFNLLSFGLNDIANLLVFAKISYHGNYNYKSRDNGREEQKRNSKYTDEECFDDGVCHVLFGRYRHVRTIKIHLELKAFVFVELHSTCNKVCKVAQPNIKRIGFLFLPFAKNGHRLGYGVFRDFEYIRENKAQSNCEYGCYKNLQKDFHRLPHFLYSTCFVNLNIRIAVTMMVSPHSARTILPSVVNIRAAYQSLLRK